MGLPISTHIMAGASYNVYILDGLTNVGKNYKQDMDIHKDYKTTKPLTFIIWDREFKPPMLQGYWIHYNSGVNSLAMS
jgi:hypothetical protein